MNPKQHYPGIILCIVILLGSFIFKKYSDTGSPQDIPGTGLLTVKTYDFVSKNKKLLAMHREAMDYYRERELKKSENIYHQMLKISQKEPNIYHSIAALKFMQGDYYGAEINYKNTLKLAPDSASALTGLGTIAAKRKQYQKAIKLMKKALEDRPNYIPAHYELARQYETTKKYKLAKKHYKRVATLSPKTRYARLSEKRLKFIGKTEKRIAAH